MYAYLLPYYRAGLDGVIVQDIGVVKYIREHFPEMPVHASTQMTITNTLGADHLNNTESRESCRRENFRSGKSVI